MVKQANTARKLVGAGAPYELVREYIIKVRLPDNGIYYVDLLMCNNNEMKEIINRQVKSI